MNKTQQLILHTIKNLQPVNGSEIAQGLKLNRDWTDVTIGQLIKCGYVRRFREPHGQLALTIRGSEAIGE